ncbi:exopolysaccharide biosynthesis polyprenyl glycosylphosphotransferase [Anditalea andensis]|uniref:Sugar transferase n=1 Tax=Anditalea andensis TaxID=1048983 RepID=A0A074KSD2_9BACT|nr:exopolysaccharide biosynthesis polyprenyl glycosylphosphotransferase [Anditalea andensis]KEO71824.1 sugar transferase [Anditalea andensis]
MKKSILIVPFSIVIHLLIINLTLYYFTPETYLIIPGVEWFSIAWLAVAVGLNFYPTGRRENFWDNVSRYLQQVIIYILAYFTILSFFKVEFDPIYQLEVMGLLFVILTVYRWFFFYGREVYRREGGNSASVVVIGKDQNLEKIKRVFDKPEYGFRYKGYFDNLKFHDQHYLGNVNDAYDYILEEGIDQIYCMASQLERSELQDLINFADNNMKKIKIIPDNKEIFTSAMSVELYNTIPVLNLRMLPLDTEVAQITKRAFDIFFSSLVIIGVLSWLTPLLFVLIKLESRGPLFFKQLRHGYNKEPFWCYKFRSMTVNKDADSKMTTKGDKRITRIGKILRKTSIDELPQFFNVFLGDMSVVGPRPHMEAQTTLYEQSVDKYLVRHFGLPGITGLAQIRGYRGEIEKPADIINRTRMDIFYLENWSVLLDLKIIFSTIKNAVLGEDKAY